MNKDYLILTETTRHGNLLERKWSVISSLSNPEGAGFNLLTDHPIKNLVVKGYEISKIVSMMEEYKMSLQDLIILNQKCEELEQKLELANLQIKQKDEEIEYLKKELREWSKYEN